MDTDAINLALLILRVAVGVVMFAHGYNHIFGGGKIAGTAGWFESLGMKPGKVHAWVASLAEVAAGVGLVTGLLMPLCGAAVLGTMLVAWITNHRSNGFFIFRPGEGYEYVMTLCAVGFALAVVGAGEWSLDNALGLWGDDSWSPGWTGLWIALVAGVGGAVALLAVSWRPQRKPAG